MNTQTNPQRPRKPSAAGPAPHGFPRALLLVGLLLVGVATSAPAAAKGPATPAASAQAALDRWLKTKDVAAAHVGASVVCLDDGTTWAEHDADTLMVPASGTKLLTTAAVLDLLPQDLQWTTALHGHVGADPAALSGDLVLVGSGDPQLSTEQLDGLAAAVAATGLTRVEGDLVVDASLFAGPLLPPAFDAKTTDASYRPAISAAGMNYGAVLVSVRPGKAAGDPLRVTVSPDSGAVVVSNDGTTTSEAGAELAVTALDRDDGRTSVVVKGTMKLTDKGFADRKRVADPGLLTGYVLKGLLDKHGVAVAGKVRVATSAVADPGPALASVASKSLPETLTAMNTWSNNAIAETLFKHLGGTGATARTWSAAATAVTAALAARGLGPNEVTIVNGSGLYEGTKVTARGMTKLLQGFGGDDPRSVAFRGSLAVAGEPGTLHYRLRRGDTRGKLRAKTGTLDEVHSLAGYVTAKSGCHLAFALFINDAAPKRSKALRSALDQLILTLVRL